MDSISLENPFKAESAEDALKWLNENVEGDIEEFYIIGDVIGQGAFSTIRYGVNRKTKKGSAIKTIAKARAFQQMNLATEVRVLKKLSHHPNINEFLGLFHSPTHYDIALDYAQGGDLLDVLIKRIEKGAQYTETEVALILRQVVDAINHCHKNNILHRDLKPENLLVSSEDALSAPKWAGLLQHPVKLADFGLAAQFEPGESLIDLCGTATYMAPERLKNKLYNESSDIWSIGVIMFCLIAGFFPFEGKTVQEMRKSVGDPRLPRYDGPEFQNISPACLSLLRDDLLNINPKKRPTAPALLEHPWINGISASKNTMEGALEKLKRFNAKRKFKGAVMAMMATNRMKNMLTRMRCEKLILDLAKTGISPEKLLDLNRTFTANASFGCYMTKDSFINVLRKEFSLAQDSVLPSTLFEIKHSNQYIDGRDICIALASKVCRTEEEILSLAFRLFDADGNGTIELEEYKTMVRCMLVSLGEYALPSNEWLEYEFKRADIDGNGVIDLDEFVLIASTNQRVKAYFKSVSRLLVIGDETKENVIKVVESNSMRDLAAKAAAAEKVIHPESSEDLISKRKLSSSSDDSSSEVFPSKSSKCLPKKLKNSSDVV